jgi:hypothetical protein
MSDDTPIIEPDEEESRDGSSEYPRILSALEARCKASDIKFEEVEDFDDEKIIRIHLHAGRERLPILLLGRDRMQRLLEIPFERYVLLGEWSYTLHIKLYSSNSGEFKPPSVPL